MMVHRFDIFEMPMELQKNLASNNSLIQFTAETAVGFFMFRPEEVIGRIAVSPIPTSRRSLLTWRRRVCGFAH